MPIELLETMAVVILVVGLPCMIISIELTNDLKMSLLATLIVCVCVTALGHKYSYTNKIDQRYHKIMSSKPTCIVDSEPSASCLEDYRDWIKDSIRIQAKYEKLISKLEHDISEIK